MRFNWVTLPVSMVALALAQPALGASSPALQAIEQQLQGLVSTKSADVGIAAIDLATGENINVKGNTPFPMASTMKIAVAASYLAQVDHGRRSLGDSIGKSTARAQLERMMIHSDNAATDRLIHNLGGPKAIQDFLDFHRVSGMRVDRNIAQLLKDPRDLWDRRDSSTPLAMAQFLRRLDREAILSPSSRAVLFDMMRRCETGKNRMKALLPADAQVQHKTGTLNGYTSDVGYISLPDGRRVALAIFARGGADRPRTIAEAARTLYDGFRSVITWNFRPPLTSGQ
ncbi:MAG: serine hydrolase [Sphingomicrobium sp.]